MPERNNPFLIDENDLAGEWLRQAQLMRKAGYAEADARHDYNQADAALSVIKARLALDIRRNPGKYELPASPTVDAVKYAVEIHPDHQKAVEQVNKARFTLDMAEADTKAMIDRRKALERLVELLSLNYYSEKEPFTSNKLAKEGIETRRKHEIRGGGYDTS